MKFEAEGQEFAKFLRSLEQFIQTVKGQNNFGNKIPYLGQQQKNLFENIHEIHLWFSLIKYVFETSKQYLPK